jgi:hypothetical protein
MTFSYESLTQADRDRMRALNVLISWARPNADHWTVDHATGNFLVRIMQDREPPHYEIFAFWWRDCLYWVHLHDKTVPKIGYQLDLVEFGVEPEVRSGMPERVSADRHEVGAALRDAVDVYATADITDGFRRLLKRKGLSTEELDRTPIRLEATSLDLTRSPHVAFRTDFPQELL